MFWATDEWNGKVYQLSISDSSVLWTSQDTWYPGNGAGNLLDMDVTPNGEVLVGAEDRGKFVVLLLNPSTGGWSRLITINEAPAFRIASMPLATNAIIAIEKTSNLSGQWEFATITADMITPAGELNVGPMTNPEEFYRLKIRTEVE